MAAAFVQHRCDTPGTVFENAAAAGLERDLEPAVAIVHRASRQLAEALPEMSGPQQEQAQGQIEGAPAGPAPGTGPDGGANRKGTRSATC
jgi:hypothetical protein